MTLQPLPHPISLPQTPKCVIDDDGVTFVPVHGIDADNEKVALCVLLTKAGIISKVHIHFGTVSMASDLEMRLETIDTTTGNPTGTLFDGTNGTATISAGSQISDSWVEVDITDVTVASADVGKPIAVIIQAPSGYTGNGNAEIDQASGYYQSGRIEMDGTYWVREFIGGWGEDGYLAKEAAALRLEYSDGSFAFMQSSYAGDSEPVEIQFDSATTLNEIGIKLRFPFSFSACGVWLANTSVSEDVLVKVYNESGDEQMTLPNWYRGWSARGVDYKGTIFVYGDTFTVEAGEWYRIALKATTSDGTDISTYYIPQTTSAHWAQWGLSQDNYKWTERPSAGSWVDRDGRLLFGGFMASAFHDGAASPTNIIKRTRRMM